jgi:hypothetical protein
MSYNKLYFNAVTVNEKDGVLTVNPQFLCPKCGENKTVAAKSLTPITVKSDAIATIDKATQQPLAAFDFNKQVDFIMPCCGSKISLFLAVHRDKRGTQTAIQKSTEEGKEGIPIDWWKARQYGAI